MVWRGERDESESRVVCGECEDRAEGECVEYVEGMRM